MKRILLSCMTIFLFLACNNQESSSQDQEVTQEATSTENEVDPDDPMSNKGIGPVTYVEIGDLDMALADEGEKIYNELCQACHKPDEKFIGPPPVGILDRRSPEWVMNMILNPEQMVLEDPIAKELLIEYNMAPMANQGLTQEQARAVLEYFRTL
jgi:mono/diheme cytochrome c family protein